MKKQELPEAVRLFRTALKYRPSMTGVIRDVIRQMAVKVENPGQNAGNEFFVLAEQMKETLRGMIADGQYTEALSVIMQLSSLLPEDLELLRIRQNVLSQLSE